MAIFYIYIYIYIYISNKYTCMKFWQYIEYIYISYWFCLAFNLIYCENINWTLLWVPIWYFFLSATKINEKKNPLLGYRVKMSVRNNFTYYVKKCLKYQLVMFTIYTITNRVYSSRFITNQRIDVELELITQWGGGKANLES